MRARKRDDLPPSRSASLLNAETQRRRDRRDRSPNGKLRELCAFASLRLRATQAKRLASVLSLAKVRGVKFAPATRIHFVRSIVGASIAFAPLLHAGLVTDGTVGAAGAIGKVGGNFAIPQTLGTKVGGNLFHSFSQFDLSAGESATFSGPNDVSNILARVTGGSASSIDGTIRSTIPNANLFLINPSGVLFGPNAKLEVDGSFAATTAD